MLRGMFVEGTLEEKLRKLEALHAGTRCDGEREAARRAAERIRERLAELRSREREEVLVYSLRDPWKRKLFLALCRRYGLTPYRERGQRYSTVMVSAPVSFQKKTLWPTFLAFSEQLESHLQDFTDRVIRDAISDNISEADEAPTAMLPAAGGSS